MGDVGDPLGPFGGSGKVGASRGGDRPVDKGLKVKESLGKVRGGRDGADALEPGLFGRTALTPLWSHGSVLHGRSELEEEVCESCNKGGALGALDPLGADGAPFCVDHRPPDAGLDLVEPGREDGRIGSLCNSRDGRVSLQGRDTGDGLERGEDSRVEEREGKDIDRVGRVERNDMCARAIDVDHTNETHAVIVAGILTHQRVARQDLAVAHAARKPLPVVVGIPHRVSERDVERRIRVGIVLWRHSDGRRREGRERSRREVGGRALCSQEGEGRPGGKDASTDV